MHTHAVYNANVDFSCCLTACSAASAVLKVFFERICNWLRYDLLPVLVLEGAGSSAKAGRVWQR